MKKILFLMLGAAVALASCQKSDSSLDGEQMIEVCLSATVDGSGATRSAVGDGTTADRCIVEVYADGDLYMRKVAPVSEKAATFDLRLFASQEYELLMWADKSNSNEPITAESSYDGDLSAGAGTDNIYTTSNGLKSITIAPSNYTGNSEARDAFYYYEKITLTGSKSIAATMQRPFGLINVKTSLTDVPGDLYPAYVQVEYTTNVPTKFDISTGICDEAQPISWIDKVAVVDANNSASNYIDLSSDYIFATEGEQTLHNFKMTFYDADGSEINTNESLNSIPVQRNYCTNISGELLTKDGSFTASISPAFADETNILLSVGDLNSKMEDDSSVVDVSYTISSDVLESSNDITIASVDSAIESSNTSRTISVVDAVTEETTISITDADSSTADNSINELYITVAEVDSSVSLTINIDMPNSTVYINGTVVTDVWTWASENTTIIDADSEITGTLTVMKGNVEIYGKVNKIVVDSSNNSYSGMITVFEGGSVTTFGELQSYKVTYHTSETLDVAGFEALVEKDYVAAITLTGALTISGDVTFDGKNCELTMSDAGQFVVAGNVTMQNMNIISASTAAVKATEQSVLCMTNCTFPAADITPYVLAADNSVIVDNKTQTTYVGDLAQYQGGSDEATAANPYFSLRNNGNIVNLVVTSDSIGNATFGYCSNLVSAVINSKIIYENAFYQSSIKKVTFNGVEQIRQQAFYQTHLTGDDDGVLTIPSTVTGMGNGVFTGGYNVATIYNAFKKVVFAGDITKVEQATLQACWNVEEIVLPASVTSIEAWAFYGCGQLSDSKTLTVTMPSTSMVTIDSGISNNIFKGLASTSNAYYKNDVSVTVKVPSALVDTYTRDPNWAALIADTTNTHSLTFVAIED